MRRINDFYPTPAWATEILLERRAVFGKVLEPCAGDGRISAVLARRSSINQLTTNDIDQRYGTDLALDATRPELWCGPKWDWVVSNPPFDVALHVVRQAVPRAIYGVAMLLRLSFLEPTIERGLWLEEHPPTSLLIMPRISFTGDGHTDSVTTAWFLWENDRSGQRIEIVPRRAPQPALVEALERVERGWIG